MYEENEGKKIEIMIIIIKLFNNKIQDILNIFIN